MIDDGETTVMEVNLERVVVHFIIIQMLVDASRTVSFCHKSI